MDTVSTWATRIAEEVAPDEVDLAPDLAHAYISGGEDRKELFLQDGGTVQGAFGPEAVITIFPYILAAISDVAPDMSGYLGVVENVSGSGYFVVGALNTILTIGSRKARDEKKEALIGDERFNQIHARIRDSLGKVPNLDPDQADLATYRILRTMLDDPSDAQQFTETLERAS